MVLKIFAVSDFDVSDETYWSEHLNETNIFELEKVLTNLIYVNNWTRSNYSNSFGGKNGNGSCIKRYRIVLLNFWTR